MSKKRQPWEMGREQTREVIFAKPTGDAWERIETQAREDMAHKGRLYWAVESMKREQSWSKPAAGEVGEGQRCDHCECLAIFTWERTAKEVKRIERLKTLRGSALPVSWRCAVHVPHFAPELGEHYRDARVSRAGEMRPAA